MVVPSEVIYITVCRIAQCELCSGQWLMDTDEIVPKCKFCGTRIWMFGFTPRESIFIRQGHQKTTKTLNKGVKSKGRQEWSRANPFGLQNRSKDGNNKGKATNPGGGKGKKADGEVWSSGEDGEEDCEAKL